MNEGVCVACERQIDATARVCPFCGANPTSGQRIDTQAILDEVFRPKRLTTSETVLEYARQRQGIVIAVTSIALFLVLAAIHQVVTIRNATTVTNEPGMPLTEIADLANQPADTQATEMPDLKFHYEGRPNAMRTYIVERGAVPPQQPAAQAATPRSAPTPR